MQKLAYSTIAKIRQESIGPSQAFARGTIALIAPMDSAPMSCSVCLSKNYENRYDICQSYKRTQSEHKVGAF